MIVTVILRVISGNGNYRYLPVITGVHFWLPGNDPWGGKVKRVSKGGRGRRVLDYGQDVAKPMPQGHVPRSQVSLLRASPIGNAYLGSGRLPRP